jgi:hypothetical protein
MSNDTVRPIFDEPEPEGQPPTELDLRGELIAQLRRMKRFGVTVNVQRQRDKCTYKVQTFVDPPEQTVNVEV